MHIWYIYIFCISGENMPIAFSLLAAIACKKSFKNKIFWKKLSKSPKKVNFIFFLNPGPFIRPDYEKQNRPGTSDQPFVRSQNNFRKIPLLEIYYLTKFDEVIYFQLFQKLHLIVFASQFITS